MLVLRRFHYSGAAVFAGLASPRVRNESIHGQLWSSAAGESAGYSIKCLGLPGRNVTQKRINLIDLYVVVHFLSVLVSVRCCIFLVNHRKYTSHILHQSLSLALSFYLSLFVPLSSTFFLALSFSFSPSPPFPLPFPPPFPSLSPSSSPFLPFFTPTKYYTTIILKINHLKKQTNSRKTHFNPYF